MVGAIALQLVLAGAPLGAQEPTRTALSSAPLLEAAANLEVSDVTLVEALDALQTSAHVSLAYSPGLLPAERRVSCDCRATTVGRALDHLLTGTGLRFTAVRQQVLIEPIRIQIQLQDPWPSSRFVSTGMRGAVRPASLSRPLAAAGTVAGRVTSADTGAPLAGAQVVVVGTRLGATTGADGRYRIAGVPDGSHQLRATLLGYAPSEATVAVADGQTAAADFALRGQAISLEGVVAVGYGTQRKRDVTGAIGSLSTQDLENVRPVSAAQALQGRVAGVHVTTGSSAPGGGVSIRIRGSGSLASTNEPLFVVDGIPISGAENDDPVGGHSRLGKPDPLAFLNPSDIASIEVLKDASSTAIYGARGTNGVVLITTKKGRAGASRMEFESSVGVQTIPEFIPVLDAQQYAEYVNEGAAFQGLPLPYPDASAVPDGPDWRSLSYRNAITQDHNVRLLGGTESTRYSAAVNYSDQQGVVRRSGLERYSVRGTLSHDVNRWLTLGTNLNATRINSSLGMSDAAWNQGPNTNVVNAVYGIPPTIPVYNAEGEYSDPSLDCPEVLKAVDGCSRFATPLSIINGVNDKAVRDREIGSVYAEIKPLPGMSLRINGAADLLNSSRDEYFTRMTQLGRASNGTAESGTIESSHYLGEAILNYQRAFGSLHRLDATVGTTVEKDERFSRSMTNSNFPNDITQFYNIGSGTREGGPGISSDYAGWTLLSYLGRLNYSLADRYLLTLTGRADGSSKFGAENKWGFFPSGALAWRVSQEPFLSDVGWLSDLKLRVSYGLTGNQEIGTYASLARLTDLTYPFGSDVLVSGYFPSSVANPELRWEKSRQFDAGFDAAILDNRFTLSLDVYDKVTEDLLMNVPLPRESGFGSALMNVGSIQNRGIEASLRSEILSGASSGPSWYTTFNIAANRNEVLDLGPIESLYGGNIAAGNGLQVRVGEPLGYFWGYRKDGIFHSQAEVDAWVNSKGEPLQPGALPGQVRYVDSNGDGVIDEADRVVLGTPEPDFSYGWTNELAWEPFTLYAFVQGTYGNRIYDGTLDLLGGAAGRNFYEPAWTERWTEENPSGTWPRLHLPSGQGWSGPGGGTHDDWFVEDGSYLRLKNLTLGYEVPARLAGRLGGMKSARIFLSADNLFTLTHYRGPNPDVNTQGQDNINRGIDLGAYPLARTYRLGINFGL
jgi:TonB-linked SusC/RagA family outer membrane protein